MTRRPQKNVAAEERKGNGVPNVIKIITKTTDEKESVDIVREAVGKIAVTTNWILTVTVEDQDVKTEIAGVEQDVMIGEAEVGFLELRAPVQVAALFQTTMKVNGSSKNRLPFLQSHFQHHPPQQ